MYLFLFGSWYYLTKNLPHYLTCSIYNCKVVHNISLSAFLKNYTLYFEKTVDLYAVVKKNTQRYSALCYPLSPKGNIL